MNKLIQSERKNYAIETTKVRLKMMDYEMTFKAEDYMIETKKKID